MTDEYEADDDATPIDRFLLELAQKLHDSGDETWAESLAVATTVLRETWKEGLPSRGYRVTPADARAAHDKLEAIRDAAETAMEVIERVYP